MQTADLNGIVIEACEDALGHQFDVVDASGQLEAVELCEFLHESLCGTYIEAPDADRVVVGG